MAPRDHSPARSGKASLSRNPSDKSEVWDLFLMEFQRQEQLWDRDQASPKMSEYSTDGPLDKESVVRRLIALFSKEP